MQDHPCTQRESINSRQASGMPSGVIPPYSIPEAVGMSEEDILAMYRLLSIAKYEDRYVIPTSHPEDMRTPTPYLCPVGEGSESGCGSKKGGKVPVSIGRRPE